MELRPIRVVHYGLGAIGRDIACLVASQPGLQIVGGIDRDATLRGRDLGEILGLAAPLGAPVGDDPATILQETRPDIVIIATTSFFHEVYPQVLACIQARAHVISTCEELVYPYPTAPEAAAELDRRARLSQVTVLGAGVNPGFVMDLLPLMMTAPCVNIRRISVERVIDASSRRSGFLQRIGAGLTPDQFRDHLTHQPIRHIGLLQSIHMIADGLGWRLDRVSESVEPIIAGDWIHTPALAIAPGLVAGLRQVAHGWLHGREALTLTWQAALGTHDTHDAIWIDGTPPVRLRIEGGLHGDQAAAALILHAIPRVLAARPGLQTVLTLPPLHYQPWPEPDVPWVHPWHRAG